MKKLLRQPLVLAGLVIVFVYILAVIFYNIGRADNSSNESQKPKQAKVRVETEEITPDGLFIDINKVRAANSLAQFKRNALLDKSAQLKCDDMVKNDYYEHKNPKTGKEGYSYVQDVGANPSWTSENLNQGVFPNSKSVIESWMASKSHAASILDARYTDIGFAVCTTPSAKGQLTIVQHKMEPAPQQQTVIQQAPAQTPQYSPQSTYCTHYDDGYSESFAEGVRVYAEGNC